MTDRYYDHHTLYVETGVAHRHQVVEVFAEAIKRLDIPCKFKVNLVETKSGYCGYAYVWISSPQVYNALLGRNLDGSERVEWYDDPNWKSPTKPLEDALDELETSDSWVDMIEDEDNVRKLYKCPKLKKDLPSLVSIPGYKYDEEQMSYLEMKAMNVSEEDEKINLNSLPRNGFVEISPASLRNIEDNLCPNVIMARKIPRWISEDTLKGIFAEYASDSKTPHRRNIKGQSSLVTFPYVVITIQKESRTAYINFDPSTNDARFALLMTRKLRIIDPESRYPATTLIFNHSYFNKY